MKTALILAGAGARGIIQAGMIKAFLDLGLEYDSLYGSSAGSLNGALLHTGQIDDMTNLWLNIRNKDVFTQAPWNMFRENKGCLYDSTPLFNLIRKTVDFKKLMHSSKSFTVNVTDLSNWQSARHVIQPIIWYQDYLDIPKVLWASASPPVLMAPVELNGFKLTDGGVTNNYSIIDAVRDGADRLIIMAPMIPEPKPIKNIIDAIDVTISIQLWNQLQRELKFVEILNDVPGYRKIDVQLITIDKPTGIGILDFDIKDKQKWLDYGYQLAKEKLTGPLA